MTAAGDNVEKVALTGDEKKPLDGANGNDVEMGNMDADQVRFVNGGANVSVGKKDEFVGLSKQELEKFAKDPYWVKIRLILLIVFWLIWIAMLAIAIIIIVMTPKCPDQPTLSWWQKSPVYHIVPQSFKDSNGDGIGDLKGIESKLKYLHDTTSASAFLINSFFAVDEDFGVTDHKSIGTSVGTFEDFDNFRAAAHKKGIKIILDFIPNHTSRNHTWFEESRKCHHNTGSFCDFYIWHSGTKGVPPNDWRNFYNQSAWTWDDVRQEYYYHYYLAEQPDLNLRSEEVKQQLKEILKFWLDKKVDGFRVKDIEHLVEANFTSVTTKINSASACGYADQTETTLQPETFTLLTEWRELLDDYSKDSPKILMADVLDVSNVTHNFYKYNSKSGVHLIFVHLDVSDKCTKCIQNRITTVQNNLGDLWYGWKTGDENHRRVSEAYSTEDDRSAVINLLLLTLEGTRRTYYGEEIGMRDGSVSWEQGHDKKPWGQSKYATCSRDFERTPMQWSSDANAGFSDASTTWLPVGNGKNTINVEHEQALGAGHTTIDVYTNATRLQAVAALQWGTRKFCTSDENVLSYVRLATGFNSVYVAVNLGIGVSSLNVASRCNLDTTFTYSGNIIANTGNLDSELSVGRHVNLDQSIKLKPREGLVIELLAKADK